MSQERRKLPQSELVYALARDEILDRGEEYVEELVGRLPPSIQRNLLKSLDCQYYTFQPRPDAPEDCDEQTAFVNSTARVSICLGGTASGKTHAAAFKTAKYLLETPPPREQCPFWVVAYSDEKVSTVPWIEKLSNFIPQDRIARITWKSEGNQWPRFVFLKHPTKKGRIGWVISFKSYKQGLQAFTASSIGGFWCNEEVPLPILEEIRGRCREYNSPGWCDFTPLVVESPEWPLVYDAWKTGDTDSRYYRPDWEFFHLNGKKNAEYGGIDSEFHSSWIAGIDSDMYDTRLIGTFAVLQGAVFKEWNRKIHVIDRTPVGGYTHDNLPHDWVRIRGIDWGYNNPMVCVWLARDHDDNWYVIDEHYKSKTEIRHHAAAIKKRDGTVWFPGSLYCKGTYSDHDPQMMAEIAQYGIQCSPAIKSGGGWGNKLEMAQLAMLRSLMLVNDTRPRPKFYVFSHCKHSIFEIGRHRYDDRQTIRGMPEATIEEDDHCIDGIRYAIYTYMKTSGVEEPTAMRSMPDRGRWGVHLHGERRSILER